MCYRLGCPFQSVGKPNDDGFIRVLIFGATGMTGTAVLSAALTCIWFKITIFTRRMTGMAMEELLKKPLSRIVEGDMFNYMTVLDAMMGNDAVFFSTTYFDTMRVDCEFDQGRNVVRAAMEAGVKHLIYVGTPYCSLYSTEKCKYFMGKEKVEAHIVSSGIPYTILHLGFYYENLLSVFRPHMVSKNTFALALPMGNVPLNCGSVLDFGQCIAKIMLRPALNIFKTLKLATGYHTVAEMAKTLDDHFPNLTFYDPKIPLSAYCSFDFRGAQELATMFSFYQSITDPWDKEVAQNLYGACRTFKEWISEQEAHLLEAIAENMDAVAQQPANEEQSRFNRLLPADNTFVRKVFDFFNVPSSNTSQTLEQKNSKESSVVDDEQKAEVAKAKPEYRSSMERESISRNMALANRHPVESDVSGHAQFYSDSATPLAVQVSDHLIASATRKDSPASRQSIQTNSNVKIVRK